MTSLISYLKSATKITFVALFVVSLSAIVHPEQVHAKQVKILNVKQLLSCKAINDTSKRLACFDRSVEGLQQAKTVAKTRLNLALKQNSSRSKNNLQKMSYTLIAAKKDSLGLWNYYFKNKQIWKQTEVRYISKIKKFPVTAEFITGALGSIKLRIDNKDTTIKVKRVK